MTLSLLLLFNTHTRTLEVTFCYLKYQLDVTLVGLVRRIYNKVSLKLQAFARQKYAMQLKSFHFFRLHALKTFFPSLTKVNTVNFKRGENAKHRIQLYKNGFFPQFFFGFVNFTSTRFTCDELKRSFFASTYESKSVFYTFFHIWWNASQFFPLISLALFNFILIFFALFSYGNV